MSYRYALVAVNLGICLSIPTSGTTQILQLTDDTLRYESEPVVVTGSRLTQDYLETARYVTVFDSSDLATLPGEGIVSLLQYAAGTDLRQRGPSGVQADLGIRGSTFEQTVVMVDGTKLSAPQTGHHLLSLPVPREAIDRIEIMHGHGTSLYGPNAFGGVINIITKEHSSVPEASVSLAGGSHKFYNGSVSAGIPTENSHHRLSVSRRGSDGYRHNTAYYINKAMYRGKFQAAKTPINIMAGYTNRDFGANDFYADFPNQREQVETTLFNLSFRMRVGQFEVKPSVHFRNNYDDFILDYTDPSLYRNKHRTNVLGGEVMAKTTHRFGETVIGGEVAEERIRSSNLGDHDRARGGITLEHRMPVTNWLNLQLGNYTYYHEEYGWEAWPSAGVNLRTGARSSVFLNYGEAYRIPTYTDLYYVGGGNIGNPELEPEKSRSYEAGYKWLNAKLFGSAGVFYRDGYNLIDWARSSPAEPWQAQNIGDVDTYGGEIEMKYFLGEGQLGSLPVERISAKYAYLRLDTGNPPDISKYVLNYIQHNIQAGLMATLPAGIRQLWVVRYIDRRQVEPYTLVDINTLYRIGKYHLSFEINNLLDVRYEEIPGVPMPGREYRIGVSMQVW
ncbi:MAG: TonB-dependent receptor [Candidatus Marinimicrobia bacterium]|nr:TonB-dependent receptor [Candidatus Neomarinimicrobiota bacterium]MCF7830308.1 TonB-dependent receptor [Candidatus Neomarinimicrobiota bacterium]MCF7882464.1 TonB-dependent receptor [Candidatus Neomarinimicrobiota bacterium]